MVKVQMQMGLSSPSPRGWSWLSLSSQLSTADHVCVEAPTVLSWQGRPMAQSLIKYVVLNPRCLKDQSHTGGAPRVGRPLRGSMELGTSQRLILCPSLSSGSCRILSTFPD